MKEILKKLREAEPLVVYRLPHEVEFHEKRNLLDWPNSEMFDYPQEIFEFSEDPKECDIIAVLPDEKLVKEQYEFFKENYNNQALLILKIFHLEENSVIEDIYNIYRKGFHEFSDRIIPVHMELSSKHVGVYYDWLWNRQKAAFDDTELYVELNKYSEEGTSSKMFELEEIKIPHGTHKILCMNRVRYDDFSDRSIRRLALNTFLKGKDTIVNDPENRIRLISQEDLELPHDGFGKFHPVHNLYYQSTYVSAYIETLTNVNPANGQVVRALTEKTYNPLIKGHFILPFGYHGLIDDLDELLQFDLEQLPLIPHILLVVFQQMFYPFNLPPQRIKVYQLSLFKLFVVFTI